MDLQELLKVAKQAQGPLEWDSSSLIRIGGVVATKLNAVQTLSGADKQKLVCQVLKTLLEDSQKELSSKESLTETEKASLSEKFVALRKVVDDVVPASLELAVAAARGKLDLKKVKPSVWMKLVSCCTASAVDVLVANHVISEEQGKKVEAAVTAVEEKVVEQEKKVEEDKTRFEVENPMHTASPEEPKTESKSEEAPKVTSESQQDTAQ